MHKRLIVPLVVVLTTLLFVLLHSDNRAAKLTLTVLYISSLWLAIIWVPRRSAFPLARGLRRLSFANLIVMIIVIALFSVTSTIFNYYRWGWLIFAVETIILVIVTRAAHTRDLVPRLRLAYWLLIALSLITQAAAILLLPPHYSIADLLLITWGLGVLPLVSAALLGTQGDIRLTVPRPTLIALCAIVILGGVLLNLSTIHSFPIFTWTDEPWLINYVDTYQRTGIIDATMIPNSPAIIIGHLWQLAASTWMRLSNGDPFSLRVLSTVGGFALLGVVFALSKTLKNGLAAWAAAALLAVNLAWLAVSHVGRQEMWLTVAIWLAFWLSMLARRSVWFVVLAGLVITLSVEIHTLGALACIALGIWWLFRWRSGEYNIKTLAAFVGGGLLGTAFYLINHVLPNPTAFFAAIGDQMVSSGATGFTPLASIIPRHAAYFEANPVEFILLIVGIIWTFRRGTSQAARSVGVFTLLLFALYALLVSDVNPYYVMTWIPGLVVILALMLHETAQRWRAPFAVALAAAALLTILLVRHNAAENWNERALHALGEVAAQLPDDGTVVANTLFYMPIRSPQFISLTHIYTEAEKTNQSPWMVIQHLAPQWLIDGAAETRDYTPEFLTFGIETRNASLEIPQVDLVSEYEVYQVIDTELGQFTIWRRRIGA